MKTSRNGIFLFRGEECSFLFQPVTIEHYPEEKESQLQLDIPMIVVCDGLCKHVYLHQFKCLHGTQSI